jgi:uncharacterized Rmd1/YagE family protein
MNHGYETDAGIIKERKNEGERMSKEQRKKAGFNRLTAYCVAESFNMKLLASFYVGNTTWFQGCLMTHFIR